MYQGMHDELMKVYLVFVFGLVTVPTLCKEGQSTYPVLLLWKSDQIALHVKTQDTGSQNSGMRCVWNFGKQWFCLYLMGIASWFMLLSMTSSVVT